METSLEISLPNVELVESMDFGFKSENGKMVPVFGDVTSIPSKLKKTLADKMKNAIKTNGGATLTAALAVGIKLTLILGVRANGVPIEIPIPLWLQAEVSAAGTVQGDLASGVLFSTSGQVKVEVTSSLTAADIGARIPGRDETIGVLCDAIAELAPACIRDIIAEFCIIPLEKAIPDFDAIEFELTKIPKLDFGVLASFTKKFGSAEGGTVPGQSAQCTIQLKKRRSSSSCQSGKSYWCQGDNMFVARGYRGDFVCNGGSKQVRCQSRNYRQAICSCAPLPKAILPCTLRTGQLRPSGGGGGGGAAAGVYYPYRPAQNPTKPDCGESACWGSFPGYEMPTYAYWKVGGGFTAGGPGVTYTLEDAKVKCSAESECSGVQCDGNQFHQADSANDEAKPAVPLYGENTLDTSRDSSNNGAIATSSEAFPTNGPRTSSMAEAAKHANNFPPVEVLFPSLFPNAEAASIKKPPPGPNGEPWTWQRHLRAFVEKNEQGWDSLRSLVSSMQPSHARSGGECSANKKSTTELRASGFQCQDSGRTRRALHAQQARDEHQQRHLYNL